jgi:hypothetical protein
MIPFLCGLILFSLLLKLSNFSNYFQILVDPTGLSPLILFLFGLNSLTGHKTGVILLSHLILPSHWLCRLHITSWIVIN